MQNPGIYQLEAPFYAPNCLIFSCAKFGSGISKTNQMWFTGFSYVVDYGNAHSYVFVKKNVTYPCIFNFMFVPTRPAQFLNRQDRIQTTPVSSVVNAFSTSDRFQLKFAVASYAIPYNVLTSVFPGNYIDTFSQYVLNNSFTNVSLYTYGGIFQPPLYTKFNTYQVTITNSYTAINISDAVLGICSTSTDGSYTVRSSPVLIQIGTQYMPDVYSQNTSYTFNVHFMYVNVQNGTIV